MRLKVPNLAFVRGFVRRNVARCRGGLAGDQAHCLGASSSVTQLPAYGTGDRLGAGLANAAHRHAEVLAFDHHDHSARLQKAVDGIGDLGGQAFLNLRPFRVHIDEPSDLAKSGDLAIPAGNVADVSHPGERHQMMLAAAPDFDVLDQNQLVVAQVENSGQNRLGILPQSTEHLGIGSGDAFWSVTKTSSIRIFPDPDQDLAYGGNDARVIEFSDPLREVNGVNASEAVGSVGTEVDGLVQLSHRKSGPR